MDKLREEFEQWAVSTRDQFGLPFFTIKNEKDKYFDHGTEISWQAWQASRAALVVQFTSETYFSPCKTDLELAHDDGFNSAMNSVKAELDRVGVKYE